ncbi:PREDICTED: myosin-11 isoform X2 [Nelumbo nucifera]|uniref:Myosin-11 isoform X2 n=1 Tax=Nelumbo nucifera TaxID=4432 RepID=A0A1U7ZLL4_NELNU|nr:PREDICTED: myosin-11 isoform X2 [Nelumbo nucifera]
MPENYENSKAEQVVGGSDAPDNRDGTSGGKENETEDIGSSAEPRDIPDPLSYSGDEGVSGSVQNSEDIGSDENLVKSSENEQKESGMHSEFSVDTQQVPLNVGGETGSVSRGEVLVEHVLLKDEGSMKGNEETPVVEMHSPVVQDSGFLDVGHSNGVLENSDHSVQRNLDGGKPTDDVGKEETFVDASDQLSFYDGRNTDANESVPIIEASDNSEKKLNSQESNLQVVEDGGEANSLIEEEERESYRRELAGLYHQLKGLTSQHRLLDESDNGFVDHLHQEEMEYREDQTQVSDARLQVMISDCSKFTLLLKSALDERSQTEGTVREFHAVLFTKDQEIEDLSAKVTELKVSCDVVVSYLEAQYTSWSNSLKESSKLWFETDQHVEFVTNKLLASLASVVQQEELLDCSITEKIAHVDKGMSMMVENYNKLLFEIDQLKQCLTEVKSDFRLSENIEYGSILGMVRDELLNSKKREFDLVEKFNRLENERRELLDQVNNEKESAQMVSSELRQTKMELEQEKIKSATAKEKLSLAVTKGKSLVQQRDSLKQSLAEKNSELDRCLLELQEKSNALETLKIDTEDLVKSQNLAASLQEVLSQRERVLKDIEDILSQIDTPEQIQQVDLVERVRLLVDQRNTLEVVSLEFHKLKDALYLIDRPENISSSNFESQVNWFVESFYHAKDDIIKLQDEIAVTQEVLAAHKTELLEARNEIDKLTLSLSAEKQEKGSLQMGLDDLRYKYEGIVEKVHQVSSEKDQMIRMFQEASGIEVDNQEGTDHPAFDSAVLVEKCIGKLKEQIGTSFESSHVDLEKFERTKDLLYIRDQEMTLCLKLLEDDMLERSEITNLSNELKRASQEITTLKEEKDLLQKDLERSEEKSSLVREKLSMAVKKGKGLVQEREGLRRSLDEKNTEIEKLKFELQQQESVVNERRDEINRLSNDLKHIQKLESDLDDMKEQRNQLDKFLVESNSVLQRVIEAIESIVLPVDAVFDDPAEKLKWLAKCFHEYQINKINTEKEFEKLKEEARLLATKLAEADITIKSLEDALSQAGNNFSLLAEAKRDVEAGKTYVEQELERAKEEASSQASKFAEACATIKRLEDALSVAEDDRRDALAGKASVDIELQKVKEEADSQAIKLAEAYTTIKSLEGTLSQVEKSASLFAEEKNDAELGRAHLETEVEKVKEVANSQASKLEDAHATIKSLQGSLSNADNNISVLVEEKKLADQEIIMLNTKITACMEELAGAHDSLESRSVELLGQLNHLQMFMKDETLSSLVSKAFKKKFENLRDMDLLITTIRGEFVQMVPEQEKIHIGEKDIDAAKHFLEDFENMPNGTMNISEMGASDLENIPAYFTKIVEGVNMKNKLLQDMFEVFSSLMDEFIAVLLGKLQATKHEVIGMLQHTEYWKQRMGSLEACNQAQEKTISELQNDITVLLSECSKHMQELQFEVDNNLQDLSIYTEVEKLNHGLYLGAGESDNTIKELQEKLGGYKYVKEAENLLLTTRKVQNQVKQLANIGNVYLTDLQNKLKDSKLTTENFIKERELYQDRVHKLESDLEELQNFCNQMKFKLEDAQAKEGLLREREAELSALSLAMKGQDGHLLSEDQVQTLFDKINGVGIPFAETELRNTEAHCSGLFDKLLHTIDRFSELQQHMISLSHEKEELQLCLAAETREAEHLKKEAEILIRNNQNSEKMESDLSDLSLGLEKIIQKLGGHDLVEDKTSISARGLLPILERLVMTILQDTENSKSKTEELGAKLLGTQQLAEELSAKIKLLEASTHVRPTISDTVQERKIFEAPSTTTISEISEIEDVGPLAKSSISPVPSSAHVRTMRKSSSDQSDHLALSIDLESDRLISQHETDEDKGHVFKSLNTSGLIPKQGKMIADRIDGIWVSGGRVLMSRPGARIGLIAYWLFLHFWLVGTLL